MTYGVITLAFGPRRYVGYAKTLARSLEMHCPSLERAVVTDDPGLARYYHRTIPYEPSRGRGLAHKLWLDAYSPFDHTLYIDSDSIVVRDIQFVWSLFDGAHFGVVTDHSDSEGHWFGDIAERCRRFGVPRVPVFNGGLYFFRASPEAAAVFDEARALTESYDDLGFERIGAGINDEVVLSVAMARNPGAVAVNDRGAAMRSPLGLRGPLHVDVLRGEAAFRKGETPVRPAIVHFVDAYAGRRVTGLIYQRERTKLALVDRGVPAAWAGPLTDAVMNSARRVLLPIRAIKRAMARRRG